MTTSCCGRKEGVRYLVDDVGQRVQAHDALLQVAAARELEELLQAVASPPRLVAVVVQPQVRRHVSVRSYQVTLETR